MDTTARIWNRDSLLCLFVLGDRQYPVICVSWDVESRFVVVAGNKQGKIYNINSGHCVATLEGHDEAVRSLCFSNDTRTLLSGSSDCSVKVW